MNLFMAYIGGYKKDANIELHDMRFVAGETIEDCYDDLLKQWWGDYKMLHLDAWGIVKNADGYAVSLQEHPAEHPEKLYFVNLGGYDPEQFTELHKNVLIVAKDEEETKKKAKAQVQDWTTPHRDKWFEVEQILELNRIGKYYIHLQKTDSPEPFEFTCAYKVITEE
ncbi:MAG: DUF1543 domain-containing protein [Alphaproteobacteria bacterium]